ncbi:unnamed protein product, partial [Thlaspi arvense]
FRSQHLRWQGIGHPTMRILFGKASDAHSLVYWLRREHEQDILVSTRNDIDDAETMEKVLHYGLRSDDPYIGRRAGLTSCWLSDEEEDGLAEEEDGLSENDDKGNEAEIRENADYLGDRHEIDDCKYKKFEIGQEYKTIDSFKRAVNKYAVKKRKDIKYKKSDRRRVTSICSNGKCPWRLYASINSFLTRVVIRSLQEEHNCTWQGKVKPGYLGQSDRRRVTSICSNGKCPWRLYASINSFLTRVVIRSLQEEHNCTWQGKVSLLTNARIADIYIEEFRLNPDISANQLQEKLLSTNINLLICLIECRTFFSEYSKCDAVENNLGEYFNAAIRIARTKPIVEMLEEIRKKLEAEKDRGDYTPRAKPIELGKNCRSLPCGMGTYEVSYFSDRYIVHLRNKTSCTCRMYVVNGIPCCHIASALRLERKAEQDPKTWRRFGCAMQEKVTTDVRINPPPHKKPLGTPPGKKRKREK